MMLPILVQSETIASIPETPLLHAGDVVLTYLTKGAIIRITGRFYQRDKHARGTWTLTLKGYLGEILSSLP